MPCCVKWLGAMRTAWATNCEVLRSSAEKRPLSDCFSVSYAEANLRSVCESRSSDQDRDRTICGARWCDLFHPQRQRRIFLRNASWPRTIDGNPGTVFSGGRFIGAVEFHVVGADRPFPSGRSNSHSRSILEKPPCPSTSRSLLLD